MLGSPPTDINNATGHVPTPMNGMQATGVNRADASLDHISSVNLKNASDDVELLGESNLHDS